MILINIKKLNIYFLLVFDCIITDIWCVWRWFTANENCTHNVELPAIVVSVGE